MIPLLPWKSVRSTKTTNVKIVCSDEAFLQTLDLIEIELSSRAHEDEEEKRKQKSAGVAIASFTQGSKPKPLCRDYMTGDWMQQRRAMPFSTSTHHRQMSEARVPQNMWYPNANVQGGTLPPVILARPKEKEKGPPLPKAKAGAKKGAQRRTEGRNFDWRRIRRKEFRNRSATEGTTRQTAQQEVTTTTKGEAQTKGNCSQCRSRKYGT